MTRFDDVRPRVIAEYDPAAGVSQVLLAERYGVSQSWVNNVLRDAGVRGGQPMKKRMPRTVYTQERLDQIMREYDPANGVTIRALADREGLSYNRLCTLLRASGAKLQRGGPPIPRPHVRTPPDLEDEVIRLYTKEFKSYEQIAEVLPVTRGTVANILKRRGVRPRRQSWGNRNRHLPHADMQRVVAAFTTHPERTIAEVARLLDLPEPTVYYRLSAAGMTPLRQWRKRVLRGMSG